MGLSSVEISLLILALRMPRMGSLSVLEMSDSRTVSMLERHCLRLDNAEMH